MGARKWENSETCAYSVAGREGSRRLPGVSKTDSPIARSDNSCPYYIGLYALATRKWSYGFFFSPRRVEKSARFELNKYSKQKLHKVHTHSSSSRRNLNDWVWTTTFSVQVLLNKLLQHKKKETLFIYFVGNVGKHACSQLPYFQLRVCPCSWLLWFCMRRKF